MSFHPSDYHPDWKSIVRQINEQAGNACEWCGVPNGSVGARDRFGTWHDEDDIEAMNSSHGEHLFGEYPDLVRIVLTTAHACQQKRCIDPGHLFALCQKCHLNHDRDHHIEKARETRRRRKIDAGQIALEVVA